MKNWTLGRRIIANSAALLLLLLVTGAIGVSALRQIESLAVNRLRDDAIPGINAMSDIIQAMLNSQVAALMAGNAADEAELAKYNGQVDEATQTIKNALNRYDLSITSDVDRQNFEELMKRRAVYVAARAHYLDLLKAEKLREATTYAATTMWAAFTAYRGHAAMMLAWNQAAASSATDAVIASTARAVRWSALFAAFSVTVGLSLAAFLIRGINRLLRQTTAHLDESASQVASAAGQVSSSSQSLAEGSSEQAASLEETSSSLEELSSMTKRNAGSAATAKDLSTETRRAAEAGNADMTEMRAAMDAIKTSSGDIAKIIKSIDEIAFQTNILALNAAVEAARAGEAGMGFAVVAEEVRALAQRSANSAKETASKIEVAIHNGEHGVQISNKVATSLGLIVEKARQVDDLIGEIATASSEQTQGIGQINSAVSQMDRVTQSNAGNAEETAAAAEELNAQSQVLKDAVGDLRRLVDGGSQRPAAPQRPTRSAAAAPASRPPAKTLRSRSPVAQSNPSSSRLRAPALAGAASAGKDFFKDA